MPYRDTPQGQSEERAEQLRRTWVTQRGTSFCIANGAVNSAVCFRTARETTTRDVTNVARIALSAVLRGSRIS